MQEEERPRKYKVAVTVPQESADRVRTMAGEVGAGRIGLYDFCSFTVRGKGRYRPLEGAKPAQGEVGFFAYVIEERIEFTVDSTVLRTVINAIRKAHPYEEPVIDIYLLEDY